MSQDNQSRMNAAAEVLHHTERDWGLLTDEEKRRSIEEALDELTETGEERMESPVSGNRYIVTRWIDLGGGKIRALEKREDPEAQNG